MDTAHPLAAVAEGAPEAHLEKWQHESHGSTGSSHKADAKLDNPDTFRGRALCRLLPSLASLS